jgi:beta-fructofuranosidase
VNRIAYSDLHPRYHLRPAANWINDPNGPIFLGGATMATAADGRPSQPTCHVFFQRNPASTDWGPPNWGHAVSSDLVRWKVLEDALVPTSDHLDRGGCWSGCAVEHDGRVHAFYTGIDGDDSRQVVCAAVSDGDLTRWQKVAEPMIAAPPPDLATMGFRDPYVFADGDRWLCVMGAGIAGDRGMTLLYESTDLREWAYVGPLYERDCRTQEPVWTGEMWECPFLVRLEDRYLLGISVGDQHGTHHTAYFVGDFDGTRFSPEQAQLGRLDHGNAFYAATGTWAPDGRYVVWGWSWDLLTDRARRESGLAGCLSVPRELTLVDGTPRMAPVRELAGLRAERIGEFAGTLAAGESARLVADTGTAFDVELRVDLDDAARCEVELYAAPDGRERTVVFVDRDACQAGIDTRGSTLADGEATTARSAFSYRQARGTPVHIRVLVDGSIVETFVDGRPVTTRVYPTGADSRGLRLTSHGGSCRVAAAGVWAMPELALDFADGAS